MGFLSWFLGAIDGRPPAQQAADNSGASTPPRPYQRSLIPGDIGYLCTGCGQSLDGGFLGMGHCTCS